MNEDIQSIVTLPGIFPVRTGWKIITIKILQVEDTSGVRSDKRDDAKIDGFLGEKIDRSFSTQSISSDDFDWSISSWR